MAELAGTAVGLISFGFQICTGLIEYYDAWKHRLGDVAEVCTKLEDLRKTFVLVQGALDRMTTTTEAMHRVEECMAACSDDIGALSKKLQKLQTTPLSSGWKQNAAAELQRLWYPFHAGTLLRLRERASSLNDRLSQTLQVLQLEIGVDVQTKTSQMAETVSLAAAKMADVGDSLSALRLENTAKSVSDDIASRNARKASFQYWLSAPDSANDFETAIKKREPGTFQWVLESIQYLDWKGREAARLWINGKAGCCKTILCSTIIEHLQAHLCSDHVLAYFYFSFADPKRQQYEHLLRSLAAQICPIDSGLEDVENARSSGARPSINLLERTVVYALCQARKAFVVIDALDECPDTEGHDNQNETCSGLARIAEQVPQLSLLITSRPQQSIREFMHTISANELRLNDLEVNRDIKAFVSNELTRNSRLRALSRELKDQIIQSFEDKAQGMFRWAACQLQEVKRLKSFRPKYVKDALSRLPPTLDATYARIIEATDPRYRDELSRALRWLAFSHRPMSLRELNEACIIDCDAETPVDLSDRGPCDGLLNILSSLVTCEDTSVVGWRRKKFKDYRKALPPAVNLDGELDGAPADPDWTIRLAHFSVKEFLCKEKANCLSWSVYLPEFDCQKLIVKDCMAYLDLYGNSGSQDPVQSLEEDYPLLEYACRFWFEHQRFLERMPQASLSDPSAHLELLRSKNIWASWLSAYPLDNCITWCRPNNSAEFKDMCSNYKVGPPLYWASYLGLEVTLEHLLQSGEDPNVDRGMLGTALQAASKRGSLQIVDALLEAGADPNIRAGHYGTALEAVSWSENMPIVEKLLAAGADINALGKGGSSPLQNAIGCGEVDLVRELILRGADVNLHGSGGSTALHTACLFANLEIVQILLSHGAKVNVRGGKSGYPLGSAAYGGDLSIIKLLLENGADVNACDEQEGTALNQAANEGHEPCPVVMTLIEAGADINLHTGGPSPLQTASMNQDIDLVRLLLDAGADVHDVHVDGYGTALQGAAATGRLRIAELLIERGSDVNAEGGFLVTPLHAARHNDEDKMADLLIKHGANESVCRAVAQQHAARVAADAPDASYCRRCGGTMPPDDYFPDEWLDLDYCISVIGPLEEYRDASAGAEPIEPT